MLKDEVPERTRFLVKSASVTSPIMNVLAIWQFDNLSVWQSGKEREEMEKSRTFSSNIL